MPLEIEKLGFVRLLR